jgi:hypothetical protein
MKTTRASIAEALSTVDGIQGFAERPPVPASGNAWPLVGEINRGPGQSFETTWRIGICLSSDVGIATDQFDELMPAVCSALQHLVYVDGGRPLTIPTEAGALYGIEITARSE